MQRNAEKTEKIAAGALVIVLVLMYFLTEIPSFMGEDRLLSALTHHFFHANILHLAVNCYATWVLVGRRFSVCELLIAWVLGSLSYIFASAPAVGFSNILFALMGMRTPSLRHSWWRSATTIVFLVVMVGYIFVPGVSAVTHIAAFAMGCAVSAVTRFFRQMESDYGKAKGGHK